MILRCIVTAVADLSLIAIILGILGAFYYRDHKSKLFWKIGLTIDCLVLLFECRLRVTGCYGYPLNQLPESLIRYVVRKNIRKVDRAAFAILLLLEIAKTASLIVMNIANQSTDKERKLITYSIILDGIYLVLWIVCTNDKSYKAFPKKHISRESIKG